MAVHIYRDTKTGNYYYWDGKTLKKFYSPNKTPQIGDHSEDDEILNQEDEFRKQNDVTQRSEEEEAERLSKIQDILNDEETEASITDETERKVLGSRQKQNEIKRRKEIQKYNNSHGMQLFQASIDNFIKNEIKEMINPSWSKLNKTYNANTGRIIMPGKQIQKTGHIPVINVYYDQSGSWGQSDIELGNDAISVLKKYEDKGLIKINIYYFDTRVSDSSANMGHGTRGIPVIKHINETHPDNVVILTDSDIPGQDDEEEWNKSFANVRGGVWFLWKNGDSSPEFAAHVKGRKANKQFAITR